MSLLFDSPSSPTNLHFARRYKSLHDLGLQGGQQHPAFENDQCQIGGDGVSLFYNAAAGGSSPPGSAAAAVVPASSLNNPQPGIGGSILAPSSSLHPLQNSWTLWFFQNDKSRHWEENQYEVMTFNTVEQFWALYNNVELASKLPSGFDYSLFKTGIKPMWEDPQNVKGGRWVIPMTRRATSPSSNGNNSNIGLAINASRPGVLDNYWLETLLCLIGETFGPDHGSAVNGAVISLRGNRGDKIGVWMADGEDTAAIVNVGMTLKERLGIKKPSIAFDLHTDTMTKTSSGLKSLYKI